MAAWLGRELKAAGDPTRALQEKRYLKSEMAFYGCGRGAIRSAVARIKREHPNLDVASLRQLVRMLWKEPVFERRIAAVILLDSFGSLLRPADIQLIERFLRESHTWALVDELAGVVTGSLVERYPELNRTLDRWAVDDDFWLRRSAVLALLRPLRRGGGDFVRFGRYADRMLEEREFFIRKAVGWVLRETAKKRPDLVYQWLKPRMSRVSGVTVREAVRWLPPRQRDALLAAYRSPKARSRQSPGIEGRDGTDLQRI